MTPEQRRQIREHRQKMRTERRIVTVWTGNGSFEIDDYLELWTTVWRVVAFAIGFDLAGACAECSCKIKPCEYCAHECYSTPDVFRGPGIVDITSQVEGSDA